MKSCIPFFIQVNEISSRALGINKLKKNFKIATNKTQLTQFEQ